MRLSQTTQERCVLCVYPRQLRRDVYSCVHDNLRKPVPEMPASPLGMASGLVFNIDCEVGPHWGGLRDVQKVEEIERTP
jgi:hypothetical protein